MDDKIRGLSTHNDVGFLRPFVEMVIQILSLGSLFHWFAMIWPSHELTPFWFAETYNLIWLGIISIGYLIVSPSDRLWSTLFVLSCYRLFDLSVGLTRIIIFGTRSRKDQFGRYYLVRDPIRWLILTFFDFITINVCFSIIYLTFGASFEPKLETKIAAFYQSLGVFLSNASSSPTNDIARVVSTIEILCVFLMIIVVVPVVLSVIRVKEYTDEPLGNWYDHD